MAITRIIHEEPKQHHPTVTRFEVIDHRQPDDEFRRPRGRVYSAHGCRIELSYQDDGRTLKVFVDDPADGQAN